jgi:hypothetical protein
MGPCSNDTQNVTRLLDAAFRLELELQHDTRTAVTEPVERHDAVVLCPRTVPSVNQTPGRTPVAFAHPAGIADREVTTEEESP